MEHYNPILGSEQRPEIYHLRRDHAPSDPAELRKDPHGIQL